MKYGSLPHRITRALPAGQIEPTHRPDGLTEADIDALAAEAGIELNPPSDDEPIGVVIHLRPPDQHTSNEAA